MAREVKQIAAHFFLLADPDIGVGHLMRCDALAQTMNEQGVQTELIIQTKNGEEWLSNYAPISSWRSEDWASNPDVSRKSIIRKSEAYTVIAIIDAYNINPDISNLFSQFADLTVYFDDFGDVKVDAGFIINGGPGADMIPYPDKPGVSYLLGTEYQVLRKPFRQPARRVHRNCIQRVGIMLGGTDHRGAARELARLLRSELHEDVSIFIVGTEDSSTSGNGIEYTGFLTSRDLRELFLGLDILITAGGQTMAEAVACELPTIAIKTAENQKFNIYGWQRAGVCIFIGDISMQTFQSELRNAIHKLMSINERRKMSDKCKLVALHMGASQLTNELIKACLILPQKSK
jgi:UDP-2,4-diacetamido-2,4,6-trideoxy-beta-L-altropyranose hydrolase